MHTACVGGQGFGGDGQDRERENGRLPHTPVRKIAGTDARGHQGSGYFPNQRVGDADPQVHTEGLWFCCG